MIEKSLKFLKTNNGKLNYEFVNYLKKLKRIIFR